MSRGGRGRASEASAWREGCGEEQFPVKSPRHHSHPPAAWPLRAKVTGLAMAVETV